MQTEEGDHVFRPFPVLDFGAAGGWQKRKLGEQAYAGMAVPPDQQVLQQRRVGKQLDILEGAGNAKPGDHIRRGFGNVLPIENQFSIR